MPAMPTMLMASRCSINTGWPFEGLLFHTDTGVVIGSYFVGTGKFECRPGITPEQLLAVLFRKEIAQAQSESAISPKALQAMLKVVQREIREHGRPNRKLLKQAS